MTDQRILPPPLGAIDDKDMPFLVENPENYPQNRSVSGDKYPSMWQFRPHPRQ
jgi:hypothetical protein